MATISASDRTAIAAVDAIRAGRVDDLRALLVAHPDLATAWIGDDVSGRTLLHVATDWPGHFPEVGATIGALVAAGARVDARFVGPHSETPLHWAASSDDVDAVHALLDAGADIDADGGVVAGSTPLADATAFGQWAAATALVARGAHARAFDLAALGLTGDLIALLDRVDTGAADDVHAAFWSECHGGQLATAKALLARGADIDWVPGWERATPLDIAARSGAQEVVLWLRGVGAHAHRECHHDE